MKTMPALTVLLLAAGLTASVFAGSPSQPNHRHSPNCLPAHWLDGCTTAHSHLDAWQELYWRWAYGDVSIPTDKNSNAVVGNVVLMPVPSTPGDGTPGTQDVTLQSGQSFFLPLWTLSGTSYSDGTPPDPFEPDSVFKTLEITFKVDGRTVVNSANVMCFYSKFAFDPVIPIVGVPPYEAVIWFEGVGVLQHPLPPGNHTLTLHAKNTQLVWGSTFEYNNTWNVTVKQGACRRSVPRIWGTEL